MLQSRGLVALGAGPRFGDVAILAFLVAQALDGILTYLGVLTLGHGPMAEGNPLLAHLMGTIGVGTTLAIAKGLAAGCGALLHLVAVHRLVAGLTLLYVGAAIVPWTHILLTGSLF
jgi:hypothetical protein